MQIIPETRCLTKFAFIKVKLYAIQHLKITNNSNKITNATTFRSN
jgi:hypothetical protein